MGFLKKLFGGGQSADAQFFYVRPGGCDDVIRLRINLNNDLSKNDDGTYFVRKVISPSNWRCDRGGEINLYFDSSKNFIEAATTKVELVSKEDYDAWIASQQLT
ncbi:MAG: hypothetical protein D6737_20410 [Chloroflexi bacterium]|nr:MAG: hypothetical protein D6737_20410 [Chloroflexota bacterium]